MPSGSFHSVLLNNSEVKSNTEVVHLGYAKKIVDSSFSIIDLNLMHPSYRMSGLGVLKMPNEGTSISFMDSGFANLPTCKNVFVTSKSILTVL